MNAIVMQHSKTLIERLDTIPDNRDNRGKRHALSFVLACVLMAILSNRSTLSSIQRFIQHKITWLKTLFDAPTATVVSRAQLPNILASADWTAFNQVLTELFDLCLDQEAGEWKAVDGKSLKGTIADVSQAHEHERIVTLVGHDSHAVFGHQPFSGAKDSEVTVTREMLAQMDMEGEAFSFDAGHAYPDTLAPIHAAGGVYLVQVKQNQPQLAAALAQCAEQADAAETPQSAPAEPTASRLVGVVLSSVDKGHGRLDIRTGRVLELAPEQIESRWERTGMQTLIVMDRQSDELKTGTHSDERSYYVSNLSTSGHEQELFDAVRGHWRVESMNWVRDVTLHEDQVRTKNPHTGQMLSGLRTMALTVLQALHSMNLTATLEGFIDQPETLRDLLRRFDLVPSAVPG